MYNCKKVGFDTSICKHIDDDEMLWERHWDQILKIGNFYDDILTYDIIENNNDNFKNDSC